VITSKTKHTVKYRDLASEMRSVAPVKFAYTKASEHLAMIALSLMNITDSKKGKTMITIGHMKQVLPRFNLIY
jgi:hypothetical protein